MRYWLTSLLVVGAVASGQNSPATRNGAFWERGATSVPERLAPQVKRVELFTRGNVTVRGSEDGFIKIKVNQRVRAASVEEADRKWGPLHMARLTTPAPSVSRLELYLPTMLADSDIEISLPRQMPFIAVNNRSGDVQVYDVDGTVRAETDGGHVTLDRIRGNVYAHTGLGDVHLGTIGGSVICSSGGGTVTLVSAADADCATAGGDIAIKSVSGPLRVSTEGGNIRVDKAGSIVRAKSMAGLVEVGQAGGPVFADSGGGTVRVKGGSGPMVVSTLLGNILAELLAGAQLADSSLASGSGDIIVMIPARLGLTLRARDEAGGSPRIVSDFAEIQSKSINFRSPVAVAQGAINGGGPVLDLNANGTIYLRKVK
jgi:DUF4097 and DUF4098 domain-containing protein YvlB